MICTLRRRITELDAALSARSELVRELREEADGLRARLLVQAAQLETASRALRREVLEHEATGDRYRALFERYPQPLWVYDLDSLRFLAVNDAAVAAYGWTRDEFLRMTVMDIRPPEEADRLRRHLRTLAPVWTRGGVWVHRRRDGSRREVEVSSHELRFGPHRARLVVAHDVSRRREVEAQLAASRGVAHDFNNILTAIMGATALLDAMLDGQPAAAEEVAIIRRSAERAAALTSQLLALGRRQVLRPTRLSLPHVVTDAAPMLRRALGDGAELVVEQADGAGFVVADATQLMQVMLNLVVNARDAMPDGGRVTIATGRSRDHGQDGNGWVTLSVRDTGHGMTDEVRAHLFEPFFTTKAERGNGLGLSMVHGIVTQSGGRIAVDSAPGRGSTFTVYLPAAE